MRTDLSDALPLTTDVLISTVSRVRFYFYGQALKASCQWASHSSASGVSPFIKSSLLAVPGAVGNRLARIGRTVAALPKGQAIKACLQHVPLRGRRSMQLARLLLVWLMQMDGRKGSNRGGGEEAEVDEVGLSERRGHFHVSVSTSFCFG